MLLPGTVVVAVATLNKQKYNWFARHFSIIRTAATITATTTTTAASSVNRHLTELPNKVEKQYQIKYLSEIQKSTSFAAHILVYRHTYRHQYIHMHTYIHTDMRMRRTQ